MIEQSRISGQVGAWCPTNRLLIDNYETPDVLHPGDDSTAGGDYRGLFQLIAFFLFDFDILSKRFRNQLDKHLTDESGFSGTRHTCDGGEDTEWKTERRSNLDCSG